MAKMHKLHAFVTYPKTDGSPWYTQAEHDSLFGTSKKFTNAIADAQFRQLIALDSDSKTHVFEAGEEVEIGDEFGVDDYVINKPDKPNGSIVVAKVTADLLFRLLAKNPVATAAADISASAATGKGSYEGTSRKINAVGLLLYLRSYDPDNNSDDPIFVTGTGATKTFKTDAAGLPTKTECWFYPAVIFERSHEWKAQNNVQVVELKWHAITFDGTVSKKDLWFDGPLLKLAS